MLEQTSLSDPTIPANSFCPLDLDVGKGKMAQRCTPCETSFLQILLVKSSHTTTGLEGRSHNESDAAVTVDKGHVGDL